MRGSTRRRADRSYSDKRVALDAGQAVNEYVAVRLNAFYENSDTFRQYGHFERYGINPTVTLKPTDDTKVKLSYEFYHDFRLADRGNPSQGLPGGATRFNPTAPFAPNGDLTTFFGSPIYNYAQGRRADRHGRHRARLRQRTDREERIALRRLQPRLSQRLSRRHGAALRCGAVTPDQTPVTLNAYQNYTPRENAFNQTDFVYKTVDRPVRHTIAFGTEFGRQTGLSLRDTGFFPNNANNPLRSSSIRSIRPISARSCSIISRPTPTASIGSTSPRAMRRIRSS